MTKTNPVSKKCQSVSLVQFNLIIIISSEKDLIGTVLTTGNLNMGCCTRAAFIMLRNTNCLENTSESRNTCSVCSLCWTQVALFFYVFNRFWLTVKAWRCKKTAYYQQDKLLVIFSFCGGLLLKTSVHTLKKRKSMTETNLTPSELNLLSHFQGPCLCSPQRLRLLKDLAVKVWRMWIFLLAPRPRSSSTTWSWSCRILCMALKRLPHICQLRVRRHEYLLVSKGDKRQIVGVWGMNVLRSIYTYRITANGSCEDQSGWTLGKLSCYKIIV